MQVTSANFSNFSINTQKVNKNIQDESFDEYMEVPSNLQRLGIDEKYTDKKDKKDEKNESSIAQEHQNTYKIKLRPEIEALDTAIDSKAAASKKSSLENSKQSIKSDLKDLTAKLVNAANNIENSENSKLKFKEVLSQVLKEADDKSDLENSKKANFEN